MDQAYVLKILNELKSKNIEVVVDGGWGIDALIGRQTRPHSDLDIAIKRQDSQKLRDLLSSLNYKEQQRADASAWNYVMVDNNGHEIDIHVYEFDDDAKNVYGIQYPKESLQGKGTIGGDNVKCITAEWVVKFHENYQPADKDYKDIKNLMDIYAVSPPRNYDKEKLARH